MSSAPSVWILTDAPYPGGAERYLELLLEAAGPHRMGVVALESPGLSPWLQSLREQGFRVDPLKPSHRIGEWQAFRAWVREVRPRVLHVNMPGPYDGLLATAPRLAKSAGVPRVIVTEHLPGVGRVGRRYWWKRAMLGAVDRAITVCEAHAAMMSSTFGYPSERVVAIHNGIADPNPDARISVDEPALLPADLAAREVHPGLRVVQVGALDRRKGGDVLLAAVRQLFDRGLRFNLWFVGEGDERSALEEMARASGLADHVHFAGRRDDVAAILRACDVAVLASRREGLPFVLIEAAAWGLPAVATDVDGVSEIVLGGRTGCLAKPDDVVTLTSGLQELLVDEEKRLSMGHRARAHFEVHFTARRMLDATFRQYGEVAASWMLTTSS